MVVAVAVLVVFSGLGSAFAYTLAGTVYGGSARLSNAVVSLTNENTSSQVGSVTTDANGAYSFSGVTDGAYRLSVTPSAESHFNNATVGGVLVNGADVTQNVVLVQSASLLSGTVSTPGGVGVSNVNLSVYEEASGAFVDSTLTDAGGRYSLSLPIGTYRISVQGGGDFNYPPSNVPLPQYFVGSGIVDNLSISAATTQDIVLPLVTLKGKITDSAGTPLQNVTISLASHREDQTAGYYAISQDYAFSDPDGNYSIPCISGTGYSVQLSPDQGSGLAQSIVNGIDVPADATRDFVLQAGNMLSGTVRTPGGAGIGNVLLYAYAHGTETVIGFATTDANGSYSMPLGSGSYDMTLVAGSGIGSGGNGVPMPQNLFGDHIVQDLDVSAATTQDIVLPLVTLTGKTTDSTGTPVGNVLINLAQHRQDESVGSYLINEDSTTSDADGNYTLPMIAGTGYSLTLVPADETGLATSVVTGIDVTADCERNLVVQPAITLSGTVSTPGGVGVSNIYVFIYDQASSAYAGQAVTDADGHYVLAVATGTYKMFLSGGIGTGHGPSNIPLPSRIYGAEIEQNIAVTSATVRNVIIPLVTLSGRVVDGSGAPVYLAEVKADYHNQPERSGYYYVDPTSTLTDLSGNYRLPFIAGTGYSLTVTPQPRTALAPVAVPNLNVTQDSSLDVVLNQLPVLTVVRNGSGAGSVTSADTAGAINCGSTCSGGFAPGTVVSLSAGPAAGSTFAGWSGCDSVNGTTCTVTMNAARNVIATFSDIPPAPAISGTPAGSVVSGAPYSFIPAATNAAGFTISGKPSWAVFDTSTGALTGTPGSSDVGTFNDIAITAYNGNLSASLPAFAITVLPTINTVMSTAPQAPDGSNGWFVTPPAITLSSNVPGVTYYKWEGYGVSTAAASWIPGGTPLNIQGDDTGAWYDLPFGFNFYGRSYSRVFLSSNGLMRFDAEDTSFTGSSSDFAAKAAIAPLWDDLLTYTRSGDDVYVFQDGDSVGFRWQATSIRGGTDTNFEAVLYRDGRIRFNYAAQAGNLFPTIGISAGDGINEITSYSRNLATTNNMASIVYTPAAWSRYSGPISTYDRAGTLSYYSTDTAGNSEAPQHQAMKIDSAPPVTAATYVSGGVAAPGMSGGLPPGVTLTCSDPARSTLMGGAIQGYPLALSGMVTTWAGSAGAEGSADGTGPAARFKTPYGITTDGINLYVTDTHNETIRKVVIATGAVTTLAGSAGVTGSADGIGPAASFDTPRGITTDGTNLYVVDANNQTIRKVVIATGAVTTLAGRAGEVGSADGTGADARFNYPIDITTDGSNLYVADTQNSTIRKIVIATGEVTTLAGRPGQYGSADGTGPEAWFTYPGSITTDGTNVYVGDEPNETIRKIVIATGEVTTLAGTPWQSGSADGTGADARFHWPDAMTTDGTNLYVTEEGNSTVRKIVIATGEVTTLAGSAGEYASVDGTGSAARFNTPNGITTDGSNLYVMDSYNNTIRKMSGADHGGPGSGCAATYYCLGEECTPDAVSHGYVYVDGFTAMRFFSTDNAGNREPVQSLAFNVQKLTVAQAGTGSGQITASDGSFLRATYPTGTTLTLTATASIVSQFVSWSGCDSVSWSQCTVTMNAARNVTATFVLLVPSISGTPATRVAAGTSYSFVPSAQRATRFVISNKPAWASFNAYTGALTGTPGYGSGGIYSNIAISALNSAGLTSLAPFSITVAVPMLTVSGAPAMKATTGKLYSFTPAATAAASFSISNKPPWATFNPATGALTGAPGIGYLGVYSNIVIRATNSTGTVALPAFSITVALPMPTISGTPAVKTVAETFYQFTPTATSATSFSISNKPSWAAFSTTTGALTGRPLNANAGVYANIVIRATNSTGTVALPAFSIAVAAMPLPAISGTPALTVTAGSRYAFFPRALRATSFSIVNKPAWATFDPGTGALTGIPWNLTATTYGNIVIKAINASGTASLPAFSIAAAPLPKPTISGTPAAKGPWGARYDFTPTATSAARFSIVNKPSWAVFDTATGALTGTPTSANTGIYGKITIVAINGNGTAALPSFSITVARPVPTISGTPATYVPAASAYSFRPASTYATSFSIINKPVWASFDTATGALTGTPTPANIAVYGNIVIKAANSSGTAALPAFSITVGVPKPRISGTPAAGVVVGRAAYSFTPIATGATSFSITNKPSWATFNTATGTLSGSPSTVGVYSNIVITAVNASGTASLPAFTITAVLPMPTINGTPAIRATAGTYYSFTPWGSNITSFSITNKPSWATFNTVTGALSGTPGVANVGTYSNIVIKAVNSSGTASLPAFTITVGPPPPTISGTAPGTATVGVPYSFVPTATNATSFSIANKPPWASFNVSTGALTGVPTSADAGLTFPLIFIRAVNATSSAATPVFSIQVLPAPGSTASAM